MAVGFGSRTYLTWFRAVALLWVILHALPCQCVCLLLSLGSSSVVADCSEKCRVQHPSLQLVLICPPKGWQVKLSHGTISSPRFWPLHTLPQHKTAWLVEFDFHALLNGRWLLNKWEVWLPCWVALGRMPPKTNAILKEEKKMTGVCVRKAHEQSEFGLGWNIDRHCKGNQVKLIGKQSFPSTCHPCVLPVRFLGLEVSFCDWFFVSQSCLFLQSLLKYLYKEILPDSFRCSLFSSALQNGLTALPCRWWSHLPLAFSLQYKILGSGNFILTLSLSGTWD